MAGKLSSVIEITWVVTWAGGEWRLVVMDGRGFWRGGDDLDCGNGCMGVWLCQKLLACTTKICEFIPQ